MRVCEDCAVAREHPLHRLFNPACLWCGARLIQHIRRLKGIRPTDELTARCKVVLKDWMAYGHAESELRALCDGPMAIQPIGQARTGESEPPKRGKRR